MVSVGGPATDRGGERMVSRVSTRPKPLDHRAAFRITERVSLVLRVTRGQRSGASADGACVECISKNSVEGSSRSENRECMRDSTWNDAWDGRGGTTGDPEGAGEIR